MSVPVVSKKEALDAICLAVKDHKSAVFGFCNAHTVNVALHIPALHIALAKMVLFNDGIGMDVASRILYGRRFHENVNGTDLMPALLASFRERTGVFLLGSRPDIVEQAAINISDCYENAIIVGSHHGYFKEEDGDAIVALIREKEPDLVIVGMGQPRQELWSVRNMVRVGVPIVCVGAYLDFAAGRFPRAPDLVRKFRLEWAFRLLLEPRRLARRYLIGNLSFIWVILKQRFGIT